MRGGLWRSLTCYQMSDELLDELGVRNIVNRGLANIRHN